MSKLLLETLLIFLAASIISTSAIPKEPEDGEVARDKRGTPCPPVCQNFLMKYICMPFCDTDLPPIEGDCLFIFCDKIPQCNGTKEEKDKDCPDKKTKSTTPKSDDDDDSEEVRTTPKKHRKTTKVRTTTRRYYEDDNEDADDVPSKENYVEK